MVRYLVIICWFLTAVLAVSESSDLRTVLARASILLPFIPSGIVLVHAVRALVRSDAQPRSR